MKITNRIILSVVAIVTVAAGLFTFLEARHEKKMLLEDLDRRAALLAEGLQDSVESFLNYPTARPLTRIAAKFERREQPLGIAIYNAQAKPVAVTPRLANVVTALPPEVNRALNTHQPSTGLRVVNGLEIRFYAFPLRAA